jgi:hypothetical protein
MSWPASSKHLLSKEFWEEVAIAALGELIRLSMPQQLQIGYDD